MKAENNLKKSENYIREQLPESWARNQKEALFFYLGENLYLQKEYKKAFNLFKQIDSNTEFHKPIFLMAAYSAYEIKEYEPAISYMAGIYKDLHGEELIPASRIIFLSYLYSDNVATASKWYSKLNAQKRSSLKKELDEYLLKHPAHKKYFPNETEEETPQIVAKQPDKTEDSPKVEAEKSDSVNNFSYDENYEPDWSKIAVFFAEDSRWIKVNEIMKSFLKWYFSEKKSGITPVFFKYSNEKEIEEGFKKAKSEKCFAVMGPFFYEPMTEEFLSYSLKYSIPVIGFTPFYGTSSPLFFNFKYTEDREYEKVVEYYIKKGKKKFAIIYEESIKGKAGRDSYWEAIKKYGGTVTEALGFDPGEKAFLEDMDKLFYSSGGAGKKLEELKDDNPEMGKLALKRATERIQKEVPGRADFEVMLVAANPEQSGAMIPAILYHNMEFDYYSPGLTAQVKNREKGSGWKYDFISFSPSNKVKSDEKFIKKVNNFIDGMVISGVNVDVSENNGAISDLKGDFSASFGRDIMEVELLLADISSVIMQARTKSGKKSVKNMVDTLKSMKIKSILTTEELKFNENNQITGNETIFIGVRSKGFVPIEELRGKE